jgi:hypothetical protein
MSKDYHNAGKKHQAGPGYSDIDLLREKSLKSTASLIYAKRSGRRMQVSSQHFLWR